MYIFFIRLFCSVFVFYILGGRCGQAQPLERNCPLPIPFLLSGNFGELRETHFHSGIDLKTGGKVGVPVICMNDGVVARVRVSPVGYGNALYLQHADGTTTVYGHLLRYHPGIARIVRKKQYENESFEADLEMKPYGLVFKRGDTLAFSGNTGSSAGPHLHLEYRDTRTEAVLNPLLFLKIQDHIAPRIRAVYLYHMDGEGCVERGKRIVPKYLGNRKYACGRIVVPAGMNGVGLYLTDAMDDSWNKLGVYSIEMNVGKEQYFQLTVDTCLFNCNNLIHEMKDFDRYRQARETVYRTFGHYIARIPGVKVMREGWIEMQEGEEKYVLVKAADKNGNEVELHFTLVAKGVKAMGKRKVLDYRKAHTLNQGEFHMELGETALFASLPCLEILDTMTLADGKLYDVFTTSRREQPLMNAARIEVQGCSASQKVICRVTDKKSLLALATQAGPQGMFAYTNVLGSFTVAIDTIAPEVQYLGVSGGKVKFIIRDNLSGIAEYRGEVNGKWGLFEYDAKNDLLTCRNSEPVFVRGRNEVKLVVRDKAGNVTEKQIVFQTGK